MASKHSMDLINQRISLIFEEDEHNQLKVIFVYILQFLTIDKKLFVEILKEQTKEKKVKSLYDAIVEIISEK